MNQIKSKHKEIKYKSILSTEYQNRLQKPTRYVTHMIALFFKEKSLGSFLGFQSRRIVLLLLVLLVLRMFCLGRSHSSV